MGTHPNPSTRMPSFVMVMFGDFLDHLKIPPAFVKKHLNIGVVSQEFTLKSGDRRVRVVSVRKIGNNLFFHKGWTLFVQDHSLQLGDFLVFHCAGNFEFNVTIYGKNGCEKKGTAAVASTSKSNNEVIYIDSDSTQDDDQISTKGFHPLGDREEKDSSWVPQVNQKSSHSTVPMAVQRKGGALEVASNFVSEHPFFKVYMKRGYPRRGSVRVPVSFAKEYIGKGIQRVTLRVSTRSWPVKVICYGDCRTWLSAGIRAFFKDNSVQEGDVCVFELIETNEIVLKVSIFRCHAF